MLRGNGGADIFTCREDAGILTGIIRDGLTRFGHRIHAYCFMPNHIHLVIEVADEPLSRIMQSLSGRLTRAINRRNGRAGHLLEGRYKAILVDADAYLLELVRYIHLNPVRAGLVKDPARFLWSGHRAYLGHARQDWLYRDRVLAMLGGSVEAYDAFVADGIGGPRRPEMHSGLTDGILGGESFAAGIRTDATGGAPAITLDRLIELVAQGEGVAVSDLTAPTGQHKASRARHIIGLLAQDYRIAGPVEIAGRFGRAPSAMSHGITRLRLKLPGDQACRTRVEAYRGSIG